MALYPFIESDQVMPWLEIQHLSDVTFKSNSLPVAGSRAEQRFVVTRAWKREKNARFSGRGRGVTFHETRYSTSEIYQGGEVRPRW